MPKILIDGVSLSYPIYNASHRSFRKKVAAISTGGRISSESNRHVEVIALDNISLRIRHGDRVALIGHNGSGKTTLLRVLARVYEPTSGIVRITGRISPMFDITLGIDGEATGYQNIILRGVLLGVSQHEIRSRMDEIAEFSDLGPYLDMPVRTYSSGMMLRLAFAISTSVEPEILLLDEWLSAGDAGFIDKARQRMHDLVDRTGILVIASHDPALIRTVCNRAIRLEHGRIVADGSVADVLGPAP